MITVKCFLLMLPVLKIMQLPPLALILLSMLTQYFVLPFCFVLCTPIAASLGCSSSLLPSQLFISSETDNLLMITDKTTMKIQTEMKLPTQELRQKTREMMVMNQQL